MLKRLALLALPTLAVVGAFTGLSFAKTAPHVRADERYVALTGTIRAAFYYPWFPRLGAATRRTRSPNYLPTRGRYSTDVATVKSADRRHAVRTSAPRPRLVVGRARTPTPTGLCSSRQPAAPASSGRPTTSPRASPIRRRPRSPPTCSTCAGGTDADRRWPCCRASGCSCSSTTRTTSTPPTAVRR